MSRAIILIAALALGGCATNGDDDVAVDVPDNPFAGMYTSPGDFPRTGCMPGTVGDFFPRDGVWNTYSLRTMRVGSTLKTFSTWSLEEVEVPNTLTEDDLLIRTSSFNEYTGMWNARAYDICHVMADGTLIGHHAICREDPEGEDCRVYPLSAPQLHRAPGEPEAVGLSKVGELTLEHKVTNVRVADNVAFLPMTSRGLRIVSVANPEAPAAIGWWVPAEDNYYNDVKLMAVGGRRYAVLAGYPSDIVDVTDPAAPFLAATLAAGAHTLFIEGPTVYLVGGAGLVDMFDVSVPTAPRRLATFDPELFAGGHDLYVADGIAYVSAPFRGLAIVDARSRTAPVLAALAEQDIERYWHSPWVTEVAGRKIAIHGDEGGDGRLATIDLDPTSPTYLQELGAWTPRSNVSLHNVVAHGEHAYLAHYQDGVRILDLSDPTQPEVVAHYNTWSEDDAAANFYSGAFGLEVDPVNRRIYVADSIRGLIILEGAGDLFPR